MLPLKYSVRNVAARPTSTAMTVLAIALVTGVLVAIMALASGMQAALKRTGDPSIVLAIRPGADSENQSSLTMKGYEFVRTLPGIQRGPDGQPLASAEVLVAIFLPREDGKRSNVTIRGVRPVGYTLRPELRIVEGRAPRDGIAELVVGKRLAERFPALRLDQKMRLGGREYPVVGIFETGGTANESEAFGDADALMADFQRNGFSVGRLRAESPEAAATLVKELKADKRFTLEGRTEPEYYEAQAGFAKGIYALGGFISAILAVGAVFTTMNTLYAAVAARAREIATLRALGFGRPSILAAILIESIALSVLGWAIAMVAARLLLHGMTTGTTNFITFSELAFDFRVDREVATIALVFTALIGVVGGLFPAVRATRTPVSMALRQV